MLTNHERQCALLLVHRRDRLHNLCHFLHCVGRLPFCSWTYSHEALFQVKILQLSEDLAKKFLEAPQSNKTIHTKNYSPTSQNMLPLQDTCGVDGILIT